MEVDFGEPAPALNFFLIDGVKFPGELEAGTLADSVQAKN